MDTKHRKMSVLMLPWLAHGHVSPFLELSKRLVDHGNFCIYFCSTPIILSSINKKINETQSRSINLVEFHLPPSPELPPHHHTTKDLPNDLIPKLKDALDMAAPSFSLILETMKPDLVVYDGFQPWAPTISSSHNIPAVRFYICAAATICYGLHMIKYPEKEFPCKNIAPCSYQSYTVRGGDTSLEARKKKGSEFFELIKQSSKILLVNSFEELEGEYLDYLSVLSEKKVVAAGPLIESPGESGDHSVEIMEWLDKKDKGSTVFVSFGSECFLTKEEIEEVAHGLDLCNIHFLWVLRFPVGEEIKIGDMLPNGFLERVGERGMVWDQWAPQLKILSHSSIGGFMTHCGWNSIIESLGNGVPIIALPMHLDQPYNARLVEGVGVGVEVRRDENHGGIVGKYIAQTIKKVVVEKDGESVRAKSREFGDVIRLKEVENIPSVAEDLRRVFKQEK